MVAPGDTTALGMFGVSLVGLLTTCYQKVVITNPRKGWRFTRIRVCGSNLFPSACRCAFLDSRQGQPPQLELDVEVGVEAGVPVGF